jgi:hypothetical protein
MQDQKISYDTARLANLKGFDPEIKLRKNSHYSDLTKELDPLGTGGAAVVRHHYYAATQTSLAKWLRETHRIHVTVFDEFEVYLTLISYYDKDNAKTEVWKHKGPYFKFEEAMEHGLFNALNIIP